MKIKTFEFVVNCFVGNFTHNAGSSSCPCTLERLRGQDVVMTKEVDKAVNEFCEGKDVVSINDHFYTSDRHNNGYNDTVIRSITVIYKE